MSDSQQGPDWWMASDGRWYPPRGARLPAPPVHRSTLLWAAGGFCTMLAVWLLFVASSQGGAFNGGRVAVALALGVVAVVAFVTNLRRPR